MATDINAAKSTTLRSNSIWIDIAPNTFYEDLSLDFKVRNDTLVLKPKAIPLQKSISINFNIEKYDENDIGHLYIASVSDYGKLYYTPTKRKGDTLTARTKYLGTYTLSSDTKGPIIKAQNFKNGSWLSKKAFLKVKILEKDQLQVIQILQSLVFKQLNILQLVMVEYLQLKIKT